MVKQGYIKTLEAVIAIILILGFLIYVLPRGVTPSTGVPDIVENSQKFILQEILEGEENRDCVLGVSLGEGNSCANLLEGSCKDRINNLIVRNKPFGYSFECEICPKSLACLPDGIIPGDVEVYTDTILISGADVRVVRLYFWEEVEE